MSAASFSALGVYPALAPSGSSSARFTPHQFRYNGRVALTLLPSLGVLAGYGGTAVAAALALGLMSTYILDALRYKEGAFTAAWLTMGAAQVAMIFSQLLLRSEAPVGLTLLIFLLNALTLFLAGLWASVQFRFVQLQYPGVVIAFERMLIAGCLPVAAAVQTWGMVAGVGMSAAAFFLAALLCGLYYLFARPLPSSFHLGTRQKTAVGGAKAKAHTLQDSTDGFAAFCLVTCLPVGVYLATHWAVIFQWVHLWSLLLLASGPLVFVTSLQDGLWWLGSGRAVTALRRLLLLASLAVFLAALEERVVFHSFNQYIRLTAPWNYVAVTACMYGVAALVLLHVGGSLGEELEGLLVGPLLMLSAAVGALAGGLPMWMLPAPLLAASGLAMFYDTRALRDYLLFVVGSLATGGWFLWHHFWFLDIELDGMHLRVLCALVLAAMLPAALLPGLLYSDSPKAAVSGMLLVQAALVAVLEEHLYCGNHEEVTFNVHSMYPPWLIMATSALGLGLARHLHAGAVIGDAAGWALQCVYAAKLAMLVLPEARLTVPLLGLLLAASPPLLLRGGGISRDHPGRDRPRRLRSWQGLGLAAAVLTAVAAARFAVFDIARFALDRRPSEALMAGLLLLVAALGCLPLVQRYYPHSQPAKRALLLATALAALLILLRPPLPIRGGAECPRLPMGLCPRLWDKEHVPEHELDDVSVWGDGLRRRTHWPLWAMVGAAFLGLSAVTQPSGGAGSALARGAQAAGAAYLMAAYLALEFFPGLPLVQIAILVGTLLAALFLVLLQLPVPGGAALMPLLGAMWAGGLPLALLAQAASALPELPEAAARLLPDSTRELDEERRDAIRAAILAVYAAQSLLLAFALKLRVAAALAGHRGPRPAAPALAAALGLDDGSLHKAASFLGQCMPTYVQAPGVGRPALKGAAGAALQRLSQDGLGWVPTCCNLAALLCFGMCMALNVQVTGGSPAAILLLSPLLLLLAQDPLLLRWLEDRRRYLPPLAAVTAYLAGGALWQLAGEASSMGLSSSWVLSYLGRNLGCLAAALPPQLLLLGWLWSSRGQPPVLRLLALAPLSLLALWAADLDEIKISAGVSLGAVTLQLFSAQQGQTQGRALI
ncbi:no exine formation 1 [Micractinium conductrix]|uniref:No exine formation 1 n=1 Tax=Micractinium conductrix TaxID=554055 RepID=A0A2P6VI43_9CHLO|nr:no exine formation 1 [Micractinium conductrix]|eukprot:PSC73750.1 no exine formation 1 [Micractinium conductrix]